MKPQRIVKHLVAIQESDKTNASLFAQCDDGSIWVVTITGPNSGAWISVPSVPGTKGEVPA
jgi:hypothetical protein